MPYEGLDLIKSVASQIRCHSSVIRWNFVDGLGGKVWTDCYDNTTRLVDRRVGDRLLLSLEDVQITDEDLQPFEVRLFLR